MPHRDDQAAHIRTLKGLFAETAQAAGFAIESVYRALVVGTDPWPDGRPPSPSHRGFPTTRIPLSMHRHTLARFNEQIEVHVWVEDEGFLPPEEVVAQGKQAAIRGIMLDAQRGLPYLFFDERLNWSEDDLEPEKKAAEDLDRALQFLMAAEFLVSEGMFEAACENMFAAAELAVMAFLQAKQIGLPDTTTKHWARAEWLCDHGETSLGVSPEDAQVLVTLCRARNDWRYGDRGKDGSRALRIPTELVKRLPGVQRIVRRARYEVLTALDLEVGRNWIVRER